MIRYLSFFAALVLLGGSTPQTRAQNFSERDLEENHFIQLTIAGAKESVPALKYSFLSDLSAQKKRNAAIFYHRAILQFRATESLFNSNTPSKNPFAERFNDWMSRPISELPIQEMKIWLQRHERSLSEIRFATNSSYCDWQFPPEEKRDDWFALSLSEMQYCRTLARALLVKVRVEIAEGRFKEATETIADAYQMAHNLNQSKLVIGSYVAIACVGMMNDPILDLIQQPDSPSLYWPLATLSKNLMDIRPGVAEQLHFFRSGAGLRLLVNPEEPRSLEEWEHLLAKSNQRMESFQFGKVTEFEILQLYPSAKQWLSAHGYSEEQVQSMPSIQVVAIAQKQMAEIIADELLKGFCYSGEKALAHFAEVEKQLSPNDRTADSIINANLLSWLEPFCAAVSQLFSTNSRSKRRLAAIQILEAIRLHLDRTGSLPKSLEEVTGAPIPQNPETGKPFRYVSNGKTARLYDWGFYRNQSFVYEISIAK